MNSQQNIFKNGLLIVLSLAVLVGYSVLFWACNKGIDLTDESFYLAGYYHRDTPISFPSMFFSVYDSLFAFLDVTLFRARLLRVVFTIIGSIVLGYGVQRQLSVNDFKEKALLYLIILLGGIGTFAWGPMAISYNSLTLIILLFIIGVLFALLNTESFFWKCFGIGTVGILLALLLFVKFTAFILLILVITPWLILFNWGRAINWKSLLFYFASLLIGLTSSFVVVFRSFSKVKTELWRVYNGAIDRTGSNYSSSGLLEIYIDDLIRLLYQTWLPISLFIILFILVRTNLLKNGLASGIAGLIFLVFAFLNEWLVGGTLNKYQLGAPYLVLFNSVLLFVVNYEKKTVYLLMLLLVSPFVGAAGTNNGLSAQIIFFLPFVMAGMILLFQHIKDRVHYIFVVLLAVLPLSQGLSGTMFYPYRDSESLLEKNVEVSNQGAYHNQLLGERNAQLYSQLKEYESNSVEVLFTLRHQTGLALLLNKTPFSFDWLNEKYPDRICKVIQLTEQVKFQNIMFILPKEYERKSEIENCLKRSGIDLKQDFRIDKEIDYFNWDKQKDITLQVFIPN